MRSAEFRPLTRALIGLLIAGIAFLLFEFGRYHAGYSWLDRQRESDEHALTVQAQEATIEALEQQLAVYETSREIDRNTYAQLEVGLSELEARIQAQEEELAFYRGIISPSDGVAGLRIQSLEIRSTSTEQQYLLALVLMQAITQNRRVTGSLSLSVSGVLGGEAVDLALDDLLGADDGVTEIFYDFRYFQGFELEFVLPEEFSPAAIEVQIQPKEPPGEGIKQVFQWVTISA
jgi:hypothetical protein